MRDDLAADVAASLSLGVTSRVVMSAPAPGGKGTTTRTGLAG
jgi:hypothetical protein